MSKIINEPLTLNQLKNIIEKNGNYVTGIIEIDLEFIIENDYEAFLDKVSEKLIGRETLMDITYKCIGLIENGQKLLFKIRGNAEELLEEIE